MKGLLLAGVSAAVVGWGAAAQAQEGGAAPAALEEIVVTAQRRSENLQNVPVSVSALDAQALQDAHVTDSLEIAASLPNVEIKTYVGTPNVFIRGVGNNDFNATSVSPVTLYRDEVPLSSTASQVFGLLDTASVEVLRGPQGTLFGKNTIGGAILYSSKLPGDAYEGEARIGYGRFNLFEVSAGVTAPIADDVLSVRVAGMLQRRDGSRRNLFTGERVSTVDQAGARAILRYTPTSDFEARLTIGGGRDRSDFPHAKPVGVVNGADLTGYSDPFPDDPTKLNYNGPSRHWVDNFYAAAHLRKSLGPVTLRSITGYDQSSSQFFMDIDSGPNRLNEEYFYTDAWQVSQELQAAYDGDRLEALAGVYAFHEHLETRQEGDIFGAFTAVGQGFPLFTDAGRKSTSLAVFAQGAYAVTEDLRVTLGGRYTYDRQRARHRAYMVPNAFDPHLPRGAEIDLVPFARLKDREGAFSGRVAIDYRLNPDVLLYASFSRGFKAGGHNIGVITAPAERTQLSPEFIDAWEAGVKSTLFERRLRLNVSAFHYDYTDLQVLSVQRQPGASVPSLILENAATAKIDGLEAEAAWRVTPSLTLTANLGLLDARYGRYTSAAIDLVTGEPSDYSGNRLPGAPRAQSALSVAWAPQLTSAFRLRLFGQYSHTSHIYFTSAEDERISSHGGYGLLNARITLLPEGEGWELSVWGKNLTDEVYTANAFDQTNFGQIPHYLGERRTYGVEFAAKF